MLLPFKFDLTWITRNLIVLSCVWADHHFATDPLPCRRGHQPLPSHPLHPLVSSSQCSRRWGKASLTCHRDSCILPPSPRSFLKAPTSPTTACFNSFTHLQAMQNYLPTAATFLADFMQTNNTNNNNNNNELWLQLATSKTWRNWQLLCSALIFAALLRHNKAAVPTKGSAANAHKSSEASAALALLTPNLSYSFLSSLIFIWGNNAQCQQITQSLPCLIHSISSAETL